MATQKKQSYDCAAKVVILGDSAVGKTNLLLQFIDGTYKPNHLATIGIDFKNKSLTVDGRVIKMQVWDTAGQERFRTMAEIYYKGAAGVVLVYSVSDRKSFNNINNWVTQIADNSDEKIAKVLVGNKCDLKEPERVVTTEEGKNLAAKHKMLFFQTSAQENINVQEVFMSLGRLILKDICKDTPTSSVKIQLPSADKKQTKKKCC